MNSFIDYASCYDLIYKDKDYAAEADFVMCQLAAAGCWPKDVLELGCGTGRHALELAKRGCNVQGIDVSERMIGIARERHTSSQLRFDLAKIQTWRSDARFDAALSLFHVMSYQTDYAELAGAIETAYVHLRPNGLFLFDFWYGPGVLTDPPAVRVKRIDAGDIEIIRISEPHNDANENRVIVDFTVLVVNKEKSTISELRERHTMRYWFLPELRLMLSNGGFRVEHSGRWQSTDSLNAGNWYGYIVARKADAKG